MGKQMIDSDHIGDRVAYSYYALITIHNEQIVRRNRDNEDLWTGDFILCAEMEYENSVWPDAEVFVVATEQALQEQMNW